MDRTATSPVFAGPSYVPALGHGKGYKPWAPFPRVEAGNAARAASRFTSSCMPGVNDRVLRKSGAQRARKRREATSAPAAAADALAAEGLAPLRLRLARTPAQHPGRPAREATSSSGC